MKTLILAAIAATVLASAVSVQAAPRNAPVHHIDGAKLFDDIANRATQ